MPVNRHASGTRMLMGSVASGDDGDGAGDWKGITALSLDKGDGMAGRPLSHSIIPIFAAPFHTTFVRQRLSSYARLPHLGRVDTFDCRWTARHTEVLPRILGRGRSAGDSGNSSEGGATGDPGASSALPNRARLIGLSAHFHPPYSCPVRVRCAASKSRRKTSFREREGARAAGSQPRKVAERRHAPVRKVCLSNMWVRCEASRPEKFGRVSGESRGAIDRFGVGTGLTAICYQIEAITRSARARALRRKPRPAG